MKLCKQYGKMLPDDAAFCRSCGARQEIAGARQEDSPAFTSRERPETPEKRGQTQTVSRQKRKSSKKKRITLSVLAILLLLSVSAAWFLAKPTEMRWSYPSGPLRRVYYFNILGECSHNTRISRYQNTDETVWHQMKTEYTFGEGPVCEEADTSDVKKYKGVYWVDCKTGGAVFYTEDGRIEHEQDAESSNTVYVFGYDLLGNIVVVQELINRGERGFEESYFMTIERDFLGHIVHVSCASEYNYAYNFEFEFENDYRFGRLISSTVTEHREGPFGEKYDSKSVVEYDYLL